MSILAIEQSKKLRVYCEKLGRQGMYNRIVELAKEIVAHDKNGNHGSEVMQKAGMIRGICVGAKCDSYWDEKQFIGFGKMVGEAEYSPLVTGKKNEE